MSFNVFVLCTLSVRAYKGKGGVWLYLLLNFIRFLFIVTLSDDYLNLNVFYIELIQISLVLSMVFLFVFSIGVGFISMIL